MPDQERYAHLRALTQRDQQTSPGELVGPASRALLAEYNEAKRANNIAALSIARDRAKAVRGELLTLLTSELAQLEERAVVPRAECIARLQPRIEDANAIMREADEFIFIRVMAEALTTAKKTE